MTRVRQSVAEGVINYTFCWLIRFTTTFTITSFSVPLDKVIFQNLSGLDTESGTSFAMNAIAN